MAKPNYVPWNIPLPPPMYDQPRQDPSSLEGTMTSADVLSQLGPWMNAYGAAAGPMPQPPEATQVPPANILEVLLAGVAGGLGGLADQPALGMKTAESMQNLRVDWANRQAAAKQQEFEAKKAEWAERSARADRALTLVTNLENAARDRDTKAQLQALREDMLRDLDAARRESTETIAGLRHEVQLGQLQVAQMNAATRAADVESKIGEREALQPYKTALIEARTRAADSVARLNEGKESREAAKQAVGQYRDAARNMIDWYESQGFAIKVVLDEEIKPGLTFDAETGQPMARVEDERGRRDVVGIDNLVDYTMARIKQYSVIPPDVEGGIRESLDTLYTSLATDFSIDNPPEEVEEKQEGLTMPEQTVWPKGSAGAKRAAAVKAVKEAPKKAARTVMPQPKPGGVLDKALKAKKKK